MKTAKDPRHLKRIKLMQKIFSWQFNPAKTAPISNLEQIDKLIEKAAPGRPIGDINKVDLSILRLSIFEMIIEKGTPPKVVIDEAVELGKEFGSDSASSFINGVLGKVVQIKKIKT